MNVRDVNERPTDIGLSNSSVVKNAETRTVIGILDDGDFVTFALVDSSCGRFALVVNQLVVAI